MYYHYDALGNVTDLTDRLGENVVKYRWDAFGGMFAGVLAPYSRMGITGKEYDPKTGQVFFGSRWYNPMVGQFIMPDTFMGQLNRPQSLNAYAYAWNNPVNRIDPTGHWIDNGDATYTAESGDTLWGLAEQTTGDGSNWTNLGYDGTPKNLQIGETIGTSSGGSSSGGTSSGDTSSGDTSYGDTSSGDTTSGGTSSNGGGSSGSGYSGGDDYTPPPPPPEGGSISLPAIVNDTNQGTSKADSTGGTDKANLEPGRVKMHVQGIFSDYVKPGLIGAGYGAVDALSIILLGPVGADLVLERWSARLAAEGASKAGQGFYTFNALKKALGSPGENTQWHHIVEQSQINKSGFSATQIQNTNNIIAVDKATHAKLSGYFNSIDSFTNGMRVRDWLAGQRFETQYQFGLDVLNRYGITP